MFLSYEKETSGICRLCEREVQQNDIATHLEAHFEEEDSMQRGAREYFHIQIYGEHQRAYWLNVLAYTKAPFTHLDKLLRRIWLECCGHLSVFVIDGLRYEYQLNLEQEDMLDSLAMDTIMEDVLEAGKTFSYEYDFGSTTYLKMKVVSKKKLTARIEPIHLVSRNNSPDYTCTKCRKKNPTHLDIYDFQIFCIDCARKKGEEENVMFAPLVNSPRTGVCGFEGELDPEFEFNVFDFEW